MVAPIARGDARSAVGRGQGGGGPGHGAVRSRGGSVLGLGGGGTRGHYFEGGAQSCICKQLTDRFIRVCFALLYVPLCTEMEGPFWNICIGPNDPYICSRRVDFFSYSYFVYRPPPLQMPVLSQSSTVWWEFGGRRESGVQRKFVFNPWKR